MRAGEIIALKFFHLLTIFMPRKPNAPPAKGEPTDTRKSQPEEFEIVQIWDKRTYKYRDPADMDEEEMALIKYKARISNILLKIRKGFNGDGSPRCDVYNIRLHEEGNPSAPGFSVSSIKRNKHITAPIATILKELRDDPMCWQPNSGEDWRRTKDGKAFYLRLVNEDRSVPTRLSDNGVKRFGEAEEHQYQEEPVSGEEDDMVFAEQEIDELVIA